MAHSQETQIALNRVLYPVTTLGPGKRLGIWFQGCSIRCDGCISVDTWANPRNFTSVKTLMTRISDKLIESSGITITGGEPFDQFDALEALLSEIKLFSQKDVLIYTGYSFRQIFSRMEKILDLFDAIITGPFDSFSGQTKALMGSDNQELHIVSERGQELFKPFLSKKPSRKLDVLFKKNGETVFAGIPLLGDFSHLKVNLAIQGHRITTCEHQLEKKFGE